MLRVFVNGTNKKKKDTWLMLTGVSSFRGDGWSLHAETPDAKFTQELRPETVEVLVKFLDMLEADQKYFAEQPKEKV